MNNLKITSILGILFFLFACNRNSDDTRIEIDFLINNEELQSLGFDYSEADLSLYKNDPDKVYFALIDEVIEFKDISLLSENGKRKWFLENKELAKKDGNESHLQTMTHSFDTPGLYRVKLVVNEEYKVTKFIRVIDSKNSKAVSVSNIKKEINESSFSGDIGDFTIFDFSISNNNPEKWEAIVFEDISVTEKDITKRLWDFGDGTIIPTKGPKVKYSYAKSGVYEVKMCLNLTNNCKRKRIIVEEPTQNKEDLFPKGPSKEKEFSSKTIETSNASITSKRTAPINTLPKKDKKPPSRSSVMLQNLGFELAEKIQAGLPARIKDSSFPNEAIKSRSWYIDGVKQFFHQRTVDHIFDTPGTYQIKMCLNKKRDLCITKTINVYQSKVVIVDKKNSEYSKKTIQEKNDAKSNNIPTITYIPVSSKPSLGFMCQSYGKAGLKSKYKCTTNKDFYYGNAIVNITPNIDLELQNAEIYGESDGYLDVFILDDQFIELGKIKNVQVLPGYSTIEFADISFTLQKGKTYSILLKPKPRKGKKIGLENANQCNVPVHNNKDIDIKYQGRAFVLYDLKYCY